MSRKMDLREETSPLIGRLTDYEKEYGINTYIVYQLKEVEELHPYHFEGSEYLEAAGLSIDRANYEAVYAAPFTPRENRKAFIPISISTARITSGDIVFLCRTW